MLGIVSCLIGLATYIFVYRAQPVSDPEAAESSPESDRFTHAAVPASLAMMIAYLIGFTAGF